MRDVRYKDLPAVGGSGHWTHASLPDFLFAMPYLFVLGISEQPIPPLIVLNEIFRSGKWDAGMSGGCEWKPFEISGQEYDELVQALANRPEYQFVTAGDLAEVTSLRQWQGKLLSKYGRRARERGA
jgi:hypothetical protein